jgi:hypothetical protein
MLGGMADEMGRRMPWNQAECWARIFYNVAAAGIPGLSAQCTWAAEAIRRAMPVSSQEAMSMGMTWLRLSAFALVTLYGLLCEIEWLLGTDHRAVLPIHWYRGAGWRRSARIAQEEPWRNN